MFAEQTRLALQPSRAISSWHRGLESAERTRSSSLDAAEKNMVLSEEGCVTADEGSEHLWSAQVITIGGKRPHALTYHGCTCLRSCGSVKFYGKTYGSKKHPGYSVPSVERCVPQSAAFDSSCGIASLQQQGQPQQQVQGIGCSSDSGVEHEWGPRGELGGGAFGEPLLHGCTCRRCSAVKYYGRRYGSKKYPSFSAPTKGQCIPSTTADPAVPSDLNEDHQWGPHGELGGGAFGKPLLHGCTCRSCGAVKYYGRRYGSNKHPGFSAPTKGQCVPADAAE